MPLKIYVNKRPKDTQKVFDRLLRAVALETANAVVTAAKARLRGDGWLRIYRESLGVTLVNKPEGPSALIHAKVDKELREFQAIDTVAFCEGTSDVAVILRAHNPWPIDMLPAVFGNPNVTLRVAPASDYEIVSRREAIFKKTKEIEEALNKIGARVVKDGIPKYSGRVYFDFMFTALRLEYGLGPFKPVPHWRRSMEDVRRQSDAIVAAVSLALGREI